MWRLNSVGEDYIIMMNFPVGEFLLWNKFSINKIDARKPKQIYFLQFRNSRQSQSSSTG